MSETISEKRSNSWQKTSLKIAPFVLAACGAGVAELFQVAHIGVFWLVIGSAILAACVTFLTSAFTDRKRDRLRNVSASFGLLAIFLGFAFVYHEAFDPSARAKAPTPVAQITFPRPDYRPVPGHGLNLSGTAKNVPPNDLIWIVADEDGSYQALSEVAVTPQGQWTSYATLVNKGIPLGSEVQIFLVLARTAQTEQAIGRQFYDQLDYADLEPSLVGGNSLYSVKLKVG